MKNIFWKILVVVLIVIGYYEVKILVSESPNELMPRYRFNKNIVEIYDVRIHKDYTKTWAVKGMVKNISNRNLSGSVKIKFIDNNGNIKRSYGAFVNDRDVFYPNQSAYFEYYTNVDDFNGIIDFDVTFNEL